MAALGFAASGYTSARDPRKPPLYDQAEPTPGTGAPNEEGPGRFHAPNEGRVEGSRPVAASDRDDHRDAARHAVQAVLWSTRASAEDPARDRPAGESRGPRPGRRYGAREAAAR